MRYRYIIILALFVFGIPNFFVKYDVTAISSNSLNIDINQITRIVITIAASFYILLIFILKKKISRKYFTSIRFPILFYIIFMFITIFFGQKIGLGVSIFRIFEWIIFFVLVYSLQYLNNRYFYISDLLVLLKVIFFSALIFLFIGLLLKLIFDYNMIYIISSETGLARLGGYIIHPNTLGLLASLLITINFLNFKLKSSYKIFFLFFLFIILTLSISRGAILGLIISFVFYFLFRSKYTVLFLIPLLIIFVPLTLYFYDMILLYFMRGQEISNLITLSERVYVFQASVSLIKEHYIFGTGFLKGSTLIGQKMQDLFFASHWNTTHAHNEFLQAMLTGGVFMLILTLKTYKSIYNYIKTLKIYKLLVILIFVQLFLSAMQKPAISFSLSINGSLIWLLYIALKNEYIKSYKKS